MNRISYHAFRTHPHTVQARSCNPARLNCRAVLGPVLIALAAFLLTPRACLHAADTAGWVARFRGSPPAEARPLTWWHWINGSVTKQGLRADLEDMQRVGIAGAQMLDVSIYLPAGPVRYGSDLWHEHVQYAIRTADELGLEIHLMNSPGWSGSGGPWITPERAMKRYVWSETEVEGGRSVKVALPQPRAKLDFYRDVAVLAIPAGSKPTVAFEPALKGVAPVKLDAATIVAPDRVLTLTGSVSDEGLLTHELPAGRWTVLRFGFTVTGSMNHPAQPEGHGLECDKLDAHSVAFQFEQSLGRIIREAGPLAGRSLRAVLFDSFEGGYQNWTDRLPQLFQQRVGYDLVPWLPVLTGRAVGSREESEAFLRDLRNVVSETLAEKYFGTMQRLAHAHGLKVYAEAQGGPLNPFVCNEFTDVPMNEFWMPDARPRFSNMKQIASVAHLLGRRVVGAEAFTAKPEDGRWLATPASMKAVGDCAFASGINRFIFHTYAHQPYSDVAPGFTLGRYGTHFGRLNTWWPFAGAWIDHLARCQFLLQQGHAVADILLLTDGESGYLAPQKALEVPAGYDLDVCYPRHLARLAWRDGAFRSPHGPAYRLLVLPDKWVADIATLRRLKTFLAQGAAIVGQMPTAPAGLMELRNQLPQWRGLVAEISEGLKPREPLQRALDAIQLRPDVALTGQGSHADVRFIHRTAAEGELYFLSNQSGQPVTFQAQFRASRRLPEFWDPVAGRITPVADFQADADGVSVPLSLDVAGSIFVVFRQALPADWKPHAPKRPLTTIPAPVAIDGPWQVSFQPGRGAPPEITLEQLVSWTQHSDPGVRFYSGIATYTTRFTAPAVAAEVRRILRLGTVCDLAEVKLNGRSAGVAWTAPFELDVTELLREGVNTLEIAVANRWVNRLIGDERLPPDARYEFSGSKFTIGRLAELPAWLGNAELTRQRQRVTFATWHFYDADSPLLDSGLLGPVTLQPAP